MAAEVTQAQSRLSLHNLNDKTPCGIDSENFLLSETQIISQKHLQKENWMLCQTGKLRYVIYLCLVCLSCALTPPSFFLVCFLSWTGKLKVLREEKAGWTFISCKGFLHDVTMRVGAANSSSSINCVRMFEIVWSKRYSEARSKVFLHWQV